MMRTWRTMTKRALLILLVWAALLSYAVPAMAQTGGYYKMKHTHRSSDNVGPVTSDLNVTVMPLHATNTVTILMRATDGAIFASGVISASAYWQGGAPVSYPGASVTLPIALKGGNTATEPITVLAVTTTAGVLAATASVGYASIAQSLTVARDFIAGTITSTGSASFANATASVLIDAPLIYGTDIHATNLYGAVTASTLSSAGASVTQLTAEHDISAHGNIYATASKVVAQNASFTAGITVNGNLDMTNNYNGGAIFLEHAGGYSLNVLALIPFGGNSAYNGIFMQDSADGINYG